MWNANNHRLEFSLDARQLNQTPDSYGIIYYNGSPLKSVPIDTKYSWPGSHVDQNYIRPTVTEQWFISDMLTINNRLSYLYRDVGLLRTGDSSSTKIDTNPASPTYGQVVNIQIRNQHDRDNTLDYQFEPVWKFATGPATHTLLTAHRLRIHPRDHRYTAHDGAPCQYPKRLCAGPPGAVGGHALPVR
jgi:iron complex outermembrane recepter protein